MAEVSAIDLRNEKIHCEHCNRYYARKDFYLDKDGNPMKKCKKCMASLIDLNSRSTVMKIMEEIDIPFIPEEWNGLRDKYEYTVQANGSTKRNPNANQSVLGRYIGKMRLQQFKDFKFSDSNKFIEDYDVQLQGERDGLHKKLDGLLDKGYDPETAMKLMTGQIQKEEDEDDYKLSKKELKALRIKWGDLYTEEELRRLETFYAEMHDSYEITSASHEDYLKQIVKTSLRMHSSIDQGSIEDYQKLSSVYDKMMKSAKFTASQEKEEDRFIDSISEMVRLCEEQGFIPQYHTKEPQDIVDVTLRDLKNYNKQLVQTELNLDILVERSMEQIKLEEEKENLSVDDQLFGEEEISTEDIIMDMIKSDSENKELTEEAKIIQERLGLTEEEF